MKKFFQFLKDVLKNIRDVFKKVFTFSKKERLIIASAAIAIILLSMIIPFSLISGKNNTTSKAQPQERFKIDIDKKSPNLTDFILDDRDVVEELSGIIFSRKPDQAWTDQEIEQYQIDTRLIAAEILEESSEKIILEIFKDVP